MLQLALNELPTLGTLAIVTLLHELGVPIPMSPSALFAGARAAAGAVDPLLPIAAIIVATVVGNAAWFAAGRRYGLAVLRLPGRLSASLGSYTQQSVASFHRWGPSILVIGRFIPGASLVSPVLAGASGMRWGRFLWLTAAGSTLQGVAMVGAGMMLRHEVETGIDALFRFSGYALTGLVAALAIYVAWRWRRAIGTASFG
jgi:membrane protein DedA with SNARE-associated domain